MCRFSVEICIVEIMQWLVRFRRCILDSKGESLRDETQIYHGGNGRNGNLCYFESRA